MWTESNTPSKIEGAGGADVPKALIYEIEDELHKKVNCPILSLEDILYEV